MRTDKQVYLIFQTYPKWLFELIGEPYRGKCRMKSVTVKALQRTADCLIEPLDPTQDLIIIEFQFQRDAEIYLRLIESMTGTQRENGMRGVRGIIIFGDGSLDPKTRPWSQYVETYNLRDCLQALEQREPLHPMVAVFKPLLESNTDVLERRAAGYYRAIEQCDLDPSQVDMLLQVFVDWFEQRLPDKSKKEIEMLLFDQLTPLEETRCGKELIEIGVQRGEQRGVRLGIFKVVVSLLERKFGKVPRTVQARINKLDAAELESLSLNLLSFERLRDVRDWLDANAQSQT